jgi:hypothetical protein
MRRVAVVDAPSEGKNVRYDRSDTNFPRANKPDF